MSRISKIQKDSPELAARSEVKGIAEDIDIYASLRAVATSEGGKTLLAAFNADIAACINKLVAGYATMPELEMRALLAKLGTHMELAKSLNRAQSNLDYAEAALKELTS